MPDEPTPTTSNGGQVMDVTAPQSTTETQPATTAPAEMTVEPPMTPTSPDAPVTVSEAPAPESTVEPMATTPEAATEASVAASEPATAPAADMAPTTSENTPQVETTDTPLAAPMGDKTPHHRRLPLVAIIVAVVVAIILIGLSVFAFLHSKNTKPVSNSKSSQTTVANTVKPTDIDQTNKDVDTTLKQIDDSKDFNSNDLSDATLGL